MSTPGKSAASKSPPVALRRLSQVQPAQVELGRDGTPVRLDDRPVEQVRERWVVEEGWWTDAPVRRAYAELVLADGGLAVVFEDLAGGGWHRHTSPLPGLAAADREHVAQGDRGRPIVNGVGERTSNPDQERASLRRPERRRQDRRRDSGTAVRVGGHAYLN